MNPEPVILSEAKNLSTVAAETLRYAQGDNVGVHEPH
jgi:hypothetical protein